VEYATGITPVPLACDPLDDKMPTINADIVGVYLEFIRKRKSRVSRFAADSEKETNSD